MQFQQYLAIIKAPFSQASRQSTCGYIPAARTALLSDDRSVGIYRGSLDTDSEMQLLCICFPLFSPSIPVLLVAYPKRINRAKVKQTYKLVIAIYFYYIAHSCNVGYCEVTMAIAPFNY